MSSRKIVVVCAVIFVVASPHHAEELGNVTINLSEFTPQAFLHLPLKHTTMTREDENTCHFWVTFFNHIPVKLHEHHMNYGISLRPLNLHFRNESSLDISAWEVLENGTIRNDEYNVRWVNSNLHEEYVVKGHNLCIKMVGDWKKYNSSANLVLTLYYEPEKSTTACLPEGMSPCLCSSSIANTSNRCIPDDLFCNGVPNCGCDYDEKCSEESENKACVWTDFEYLLMMVMTGFLLILIPVVFLLTMMYHRRATNAMNYGDCDNNNNVPRCREYPHVISTVPVYIDEPPSYDDLPDELKIPPRIHEQVPSEVNTT